ncbi:cell division protein FtsA [Candidatus Dojkabacteria bacterium]|nr:cell division protein FtsA [Candidatus Dojkabacteria bacterium]
MAKRIISALDVGSAKVCAVIASVEEDGVPQVIGVASQPSAGIKKGVVVNIDDSINTIASTLEAAERMAGITVPSVYLSVSGKHITSTNNKGVVAVSTEEIIPDDVFRAIESARTVSIPAGREILHVIPREFIVDSQGCVKDPIGMTGTRLEVDAHIVSATSTVLHNLLKCVQQLGLKVDDVVFSGWSSSTAVLTDTEKELGVMLLDIGGGVTSISTFVEDAITYSGCVPFGGLNVTSDLAIGLRVSLDDAERIKTNIADIIRSQGGKRQVDIGGKKKGEKGKKRAKVVDVSSLGIEGTDEVDKELFDEIIEARLSEIFDLVTAQIAQSGTDTTMPAGVVVTGGSALLPNVTKIAKKIFKVPARVGYPKGLEGLVDEISSPAFSTIQGLILYGSKSNGEGRMNEGVTMTGGGGVGNILSKVGGWFKNLIP